HALPRVNLVEICRARRVLPSRASGFVLRRILPVPVGAGERPFTEPTAVARPWRREPLTLRANARHRARIDILGGEQLVHHAQPRAVRVEEPEVAVGSHTLPPVLFPGCSCVRPRRGSVVSTASQQTATAGGRATP